MTSPSGLRQKTDLPVKHRDKSPHVAIIGAGFCGLTAAYELLKRGARVTVLEKDSQVGGLAGSFMVEGARLEKFYHHWFTNDQYIFNLVHELGADSEILLRASQTGMYYTNSIFRLSSPWDVLRFTPLSIIDRLRLGLLALRSRKVRNWRELEDIRAADWLRELGGDKVYKVVWEPLLRGKFGIFADEVSAVWFWNKLKLRGSSRSSSGGEKLAYYRGGFAALADKLAAHISALGGCIRTLTPVTSIITDRSRCVGLLANGELLAVDAVIATPALPLVADLMNSHVPKQEIQALRRIRYLANVCLVLELDRSLSSTYWLNVNDPTFPFVGVIEHTNFEPPESYGGQHIVYLSKYLPETDPLYQMSDDDALRFILPFLKRIFPALTQDWIRNIHVWRAPYAQPVVERNYSSLIPGYSTSIRNFFLASMAQVYPEDRGTNYAVREGREVAAIVANALAGSE